MVRLLLVEDDPVDALIIRSQIGTRAAIHSVDCQESLYELLKEQRSDEFDGIIMDVLLRFTTPERASEPDSDWETDLIRDELDAGFRCCQEIRRHGWLQPVLLCSNFDQKDLRSLIAGLPDFAEFCEKTTLSRRLDVFLGKVQSWRQVLRASAAGRPN
jgi:CheY-like chemotaxis protein